MPEIKSLSDITAQIGAPAGIRLSTDTVARGVDNYHVDVQVSTSFTFKFREIVEQNLKLLMSGKAILSSNSETMAGLREAYGDLMQVTIHRIKTDFSPGQVHVLQFGLIRFVIDEVRGVVDRQYESLEQTLSQQQNSGSRALLATQQRLQWFRQHSGEFVYRLTRLMMRSMQREENNRLRALREQYLGDFPDAVNIMFNPLLYGQSPRDPLLLLDCYAVWPGNGANFEPMNHAFEQIFAANFPALPFKPLKDSQKLGPRQSEIYDDLGGLFAVQPILGPAENQNERLREDFSWLDHPGNMRLLFDPRVQQRHLEQGGLGFTGTRSLKADIRKLQGIATELRRAAGDEKSVRTMLASYALKEKLTQPDLDAIDIGDALELIATRDARKIAKAIDTSIEGTALLQAKLEGSIREYDRLCRESPDELFVRFLADWSRYRLHLKYYRFAHRVLNRVSVLTNDEEVQLAKAGGHLYRIVSSAEARDVGEEAQIVHHCVLKADVRGSTTVTSELTRRGLNAASYFSLRFFNPITERLATYGAVKVFIEGDAVILAVYEHENSPNEWFSVSRCCGIAKEMLDIVASKNTHSRQTGLPDLELGIGICYSAERPMFLFDEDRPIMISGAIGDADRMSSCSWRLRKKIVPGSFNVGAFLLDETDNQKGEKGQDLVRYNVNGIVIDEAAFEKLQTEVHFSQVRAKSGDTEEHFFVGRYPDVAGKLRDLVVRRGNVGIWHGDHSVKGASTGLYFYEVLPNSKFASQIIELAED